MKASWLRRPTGNHVLALLVAALALGGFSLLVVCSARWLPLLYVVGRVVPTAGLFLLLVVIVLGALSRRGQEYFGTLAASLCALARQARAFLAGMLREEGGLHVISLAAIVCVGFLLRLCFLSQPMRYDEAHTFIAYASCEPSEFLVRYDYPNNHIFHTLLAHEAYILLGNRPWVIRLPALLAGVLLVPACYAVGRLLYSRGAGLIAAAIVAASSALIEYSTNARGYTLVCLLFLLSLALAHLAVQRGEPAAWVLLAVLTTLGFYTIPVMLYYSAIVWAWAICLVITGATHIGRRRALKGLAWSIAVACALTLAVYFPVIARLGFKSTVAVAAGRGVSLQYLAKTLPGYAGTVWEQWNRDIPLSLRAAFVTCFFISLAFHRRLSRWWVPVVVPAALCIVLAVGIQRALAPTRIWLPLFPLYAATLAGGLSHLAELIEGWLRSTRFRVATLCGLVVLVLMGASVVRTRSVYYSLETGSLRDAEGITLFLKDYLRAGDRAVSLCPSDFPLLYYFGLHGVPPQQLFETDPRTAGRVVFVVNESVGQTLQELVRAARLPQSSAGAAVLLRKYESASLYVIERSSPAR